MASRLQEELKKLLEEIKKPIINFGKVSALVAEIRTYKIPPSNLNGNIFKFINIVVTSEQSDFSPKNKYLMDLLKEVDKGEQSMIKSYLLKLICKFDPIHPTRYVSLNQDQIGDHLILVLNSNNSITLAAANYESLPPLETNESPVLIFFIRVTDKTVCITHTAHGTIRDGETQEESVKEAKNKTFGFGPPEANIEAMTKYIARENIEVPIYQTNEDLDTSPNVYQQIEMIKQVALGYLRPGAPPDVVSLTKLLEDVIAERPSPLDATVITSSGGDMKGGDMKGGDVKDIDGDDEVSETNPPPPKRLTRLESMDSHDVSLRGYSKSDSCSQSEATEETKEKDDNVNVRSYSCFKAKEDPEDASSSGNSRSYSRL